MATEDFTTYTEVDTEGWLTVTASKADGVDVLMNADCYLYKDFGADFFDALDILFEMYVTSDSGNYSRGCMGIANVIDDVIGFASTDISVVFYAGAASQWSIGLVRGAYAATDYYITETAGVLYYCTLGRTAGSDTITVKIYSDAARTNLLDTLSVAGFSTTKYRYSYGFVNVNDGNTYAWDGYFQDMDLQLPTLQAVGGASMTIAGALVTVWTKVLSVGGGSIAIAGALVKMTLKAVGAGSISIAGALARYSQFYRAVGGASMSIAGALVKMTLKAMGAGSVSIAGALATVFTKVLAVGGGSVTIAGALTYISKWVSLTLKDRSLSLTLWNRTLTLSLKDRSLSLTLREK